MRSFSTGLEAHVRTSPGLETFLYLIDVSVLYEVLILLV